MPKDHLKRYHFKKDSSGRHRQLCGTLGLDLVLGSAMDGFGPIQNISNESILLLHSTP